jgi:predicted Fe-S protein YdhL (DUF1289 family)
MPQLELFHIPSPCKGVCLNGTNGFCQGCFRSRDERFEWMQFSDEQKRYVIRLCKSRKHRWMKKQIDIKVLQTPVEDDPTDDLFGDL